MPLRACANGEPTSSPDHRGASGSCTRVVRRRSARPVRRGSRPGAPTAGPARRSCRPAPASRRSARGPFRRTAAPAAARRPTAARHAARGTGPRPGPARRATRRRGAWPGRTRRTPSSSPLAVSATSSSAASASLRPVAASGSSRRFVPERLAAARGGLAGRRSARPRRPGAATPTGPGAGPPAPCRGPRRPRRAGRPRPGRRACRSGARPRRPCPASAPRWPRRSPGRPARAPRRRRRRRARAAPARPSSASMASSAWLVTTMSARPASAWAFSAKQSSPTGHSTRPRHSRAVTDTCRHAASGTPGTSSSRSPVSVSLGPLVQPLDRAAHRRDGERVEQLRPPGRRRRRAPCSLFRHR